MLRKAIVFVVAVLAILNYVTNKDELLQGKVVKKATLSEKLENCKEISNAEVKYAKKVYGKWMW